MRAEPLSQAHLDWHGLDGDRRCAFVRQRANSGFPWLTGRELPELLLYTPRFLHPDDPRQSPIVVTTPDGRRLPLEAPELLDELKRLCGEEIYLLKLGRGTYDSQVLSLMSTASIAALGASADMELQSGRFRQNVIIETQDGRPFQEEEWLGRMLIFGAADNGPRIHLTRRIKRCVMVNIDPHTAARDARVLKTVAQTRDSYAGVYASVEQPGIIRVGDPVRVAAS